MIESKSPVKSRTLWSSGPGALLFLADAAHGFFQSGGLDNLCAQKSALAGGLLAAVSILRFFTTQPIIQPKEGLTNDRGNTQAPD